MSESTSIPQSIEWKVTADLPGRSVYTGQPLLGGIVDTPHGPAMVELLMLRELPGQPERAATFVVQFRTHDHPLGVGYHVDVTDLLEGIVRGYFAARPADRPLADRPSYDGATDA